MSDRYDAIILGGGPAGSTAATLLADARRRVLVLEKGRFPRFHIGESLLPATVKLFERLGVSDALKATFIHKPGGKWLYGSREVPGDFSNADSRATFRDHPYSYLVERSTFDAILLDRAMDAGADVRFGHDVCELLHATACADSRVIGVSARDESGVVRQFESDLVIDCTGLRAFVGSKLGIRRPAHVQRMGIYSHYRAQPTRDDVRDGWFVGQMYFDGWTWVLRLPDDKYSVGTVLTVDRFKRTGASAQQVLEYLVAHNPLLRDGIPGAERVSPVQVTGHMGNRCSKLAGEGWVLAGDAALFVDPCYSSGVHLAMSSSAMIADAVLAHPAGQPVPAQAFRRYQRKMFHHERAVVRMVEAFYVASRNTSVQKVITRRQGGYLTRKFVTFVGGDFSRHSDFAWRVLRFSQLVAAVAGNDPHRSPETHPDYLVRELSGCPEAPEECRLDGRRDAPVLGPRMAIASQSGLPSDTVEKVA